MRILIVSSVPPRRCGIASYARQQVEALRAEGHQVTLASLDGPGEADLCFDLRRLSELARLGRTVADHDRTIVHYQHDLFFSGLQKRQLLTHNLALAALFGKGVEVVCHEVLYPLLDGRAGRWVGVTERHKWRSAAKLWVHTAQEADKLRALLEPGGVVPPIALRQHHLDFRKFHSADRASARAELGLHAEAHLFLCIGFLQAHKGFDRAMRAFAELDPQAAATAQLFVVGSARVEAPEIRAHITELRALAARLPRVTLIERFLSDAEFDLWLSAADVIVLPYKEIWTSGVMARARLFERRVVAAAVGGLPEQLGPEDVAVAADQSLAAALEQTLPSPVAPARARPPALRLGVVVPWFGEGVSGGAEQVVRESVLRLRKAGVAVEVFTTQLRGYESDWSINARPLAREEVWGVPVHRAPVLPRDGQRAGELAGRLSRGELLSGPEQSEFLDQLIRCPALPELLRAERHRFDLFLLGNYMFTPTVQAARLLGEQALLLPFLHDEGYARLPPYAVAYRGLRGALFNTSPEAELAQRLWGLDPKRCAVVGNGVPDAPAVSRFSFPRRHGLGPYLLYVGRKEDGKNFPWLIELFRAYRAQGGTAQLALLGPGHFTCAPSDVGAIGVYGVVSEKEKFEALAGAVALVQPSLLESFSLSIMESWKVRRPVLVHRDGAVTQHHTQRSGGGLSFHDGASFTAAVERLLKEPELGARLGRRGRAYVDREYTWPLVTERMLEALERFRALDVGTRSAA